jgi:hypothetical protein
LCGKQTNKQTNQQANKQVWLGVKFIQGPFLCNIGPYFFAHYHIRINHHKTNKQGTLYQQMILLIAFAH